MSERHRLREELSDRAVEREFTPQDGRSTAATTSSAGNNKASSAGLQDGAAGAGAAAGVAVGDFQRKITPEAMLAALEGPAAVAAAAASGGGAEGDGGLAAALFGLGEEEDGDANWKCVTPCRACGVNVVLRRQAQEGPAFERWVQNTLPLPSARGGPLPYPLAPARNCASCSPPQSMLSVTSPISPLHDVQEDEPLVLSRPIKGPSCRCLFPRLQLLSTLFPRSH